MSRVTTDRQLLVSALADAIDWSESLGDAVADADSAGRQAASELDAATQAQLAAYLAEYRRVTGRSYHAGPLDQAQSVPLRQVPLSDHFCIVPCSTCGRRSA